LHGVFSQKEKLQPGEYAIIGIIKVKLDTKGYSGPVKQFVYVRTDDIDNLLIKYIIKAEVVKK
jgi:hypothetical protein